MIAQMPTAVAYRERIQAGLAPVPPSASLDHAANFLHMVTARTPTERMRRGLRQSRWSSTPSTS